ncbi:MAG: glycosyltransferase [Pseudohongiellaceae bacterium]
MTDNRAAQSTPAAPVSIICRTTGRATLKQTLRSVEQQTWRPIEVVLVDAAASELAQPVTEPDVNIRMVRPDTPLSRSAAANAGLDAATGAFLLFLDDDDWLAPTHIEELAGQLGSDPETGVAYSSTVRTTPGGDITDEVFRAPFNHARLRHDNFIPIHSALFRRSLLEHGVRFDESLDIFEDWDFWLQLAEHTRFIHRDVITAYYRGGGESETAASNAAERYRPDSPVAKGRAALFAKWLPRWSGSEYNLALADLDQTPRVEKLGRELATAHSERTELKRQKDELQQRLRKRDAEVQDARRHIRHLEDERAQIINSLSWRITRPWRWLRRRLAATLPGGHGKGHRTGTGPALWENGIACSLDCPSVAEDEFSDELVLNGWCLAEAGITGVSCLIDGNEVREFLPDTHRQDLENGFPAAQQEQPAGFQHRIGLPGIEPGEHWLTLILTAANGQSREIGTRFLRIPQVDHYNDWYWRTIPDDDVLQAACNQIPEPPADERLHLLVLAGPQEGRLQRTLDSLVRQRCPGWELHLIGLTRGQGRQLATDRTIQSLSDHQRLHVHADLQEAMAAVRGGWTCLLEAGEWLAPQAILEFQLTARTLSDAAVIYTDHDEVDDENHHSNPCFTPSWSPDHVLAANPTGTVFLFRAGADKAGELTPPGDLPAHCRPAWRYHLLLQLSEQQPAIRRIPKVLWSRPTPDAAARDRDITAETGVVEHWLSARMDTRVPVQADAHGIRRVLWPLERQPRVSIIIPTTGKPELVRPCMDSLLEHTEYPDYEVIVLDNGRGKHPEGIAWLRETVDRVIECHEPFNWARLNNIGASHASGELLLFLNDDIEITDGQWLNELVRQAIRPDIGTVGAKLLYPNGLLQHAGVMLVNYGGGGIHLLHKANPDATIYRNLHLTTREVSANTGACLMVSREKYDAINGFEESLPVVGNDVDFCLRLSDAGWRSLWTPYCCLVHHESISRRNSVPREDEQNMWSRWRERFMAGDPYYNPNLCTEKCDYSLRNDRVYDLPVPVSDARNDRPAQAHQRGVNLIGFIRAAMGIGEGARSDARALDTAQEPFTIINFESGNPSRMTDLSWQHKESDTAPFDITLLHINPDHAVQAIAELPARCFEGKYVIGYWAWELPEMPDDWESSFRYVDEIWVPSQFCQQAIAMRSPVPVVTIPHCIEAQYDETQGRAHFGLPEDSFLFLSMFDVHSRPERKNPHGAIRAFREAFESDDHSACLVVKLNNPTPDAMKALHQAIGGQDNIIVLDGVYSRDEINTLLANIDCFVSLHRSEGFGLGPAEAMSLGKVAMITRWSGNTDYMTPDNSIGIDYELVTLEQDYGPYRAGQHWAEPDVSQAAGAMRKLVADPQWATTLGRNARDTIREGFSPRAVGSRMKQRLAAIRSQRNAD